MSTPQIRRVFVTVRSSNGLFRSNSSYMSTSPQRVCTNRAFSRHEYQRRAHLTPPGKHLMSGATLLALGCLAFSVASIHPVANDAYTKPVDDNSDDLCKPELTGAQGYKYDPIPTGYDTRVFTLLPGAYDDPIQVVTEFKDSTTGGYAALSYEWKDEQGSEPILRDGMIHLVTPNLCAALRRLRSAHIPQVLWADAICIDQRSRSEMFHHFGIMREIYARASRVFVWLGEEREDDCLAFQSLEMFNMLGSTMNKTSGWTRLDGKCWAIRFPNLSQGVNHEHVVRFLHDRSWFRRTWVLQEAGSGRRVTLLYGPQRKPWKVLSAVVNGTLDQSLAVSGADVDGVRKTIESIKLIAKARSDRAASSLSVFQVMLETYPNQCKKDAEKIQAVRKLGHDWHLYPIVSKWSELESDEHHAERVYHDFARRCLSHSLELLSCVQVQRDRSTRPSWVVHWGKVETQHPLVRYSTTNTFCASGTTVQNVNFSEDGQILHVGGLQVDTIRKVSEVPKFVALMRPSELDDAFVRSLDATTAWMREVKWLAGISHTGTNGPQRLAKLAKALTCELAVNGTPAPVAFYDDFERYLHFRDNARAAYEEHLEECIGLPEASRMEEPLGKNLLIDESIRKWSSQRRFCVTDAGRFACVPKAAKEGDIICILFGADVPYVLRPVGRDQHEVVGESYVNGIMRGESLKGRSLMNLPSFHIR